MYSRSLSRYIICMKFDKFMYDIFSFATYAAISNILK